jgi:hypothetical protein
MTLPANQLLPAAEDLKPNASEKAFLELGYNRFVDLFKEIESDIFWKKDSIYRLHRIRDIFAIYAELICYEPLKFVLEERKTTRPVENDLGEQLFKFVRHLLAHFPLFDSWDTVWITKELANWERKGQIDRFLTNYEGKAEIKYRFWDARVKQMTYLSINFPVGYKANQKIFLKDILQERDGVRFSIRLMLKILLENLESPELILKELNEQ